MSLPDQTADNTWDKYASNKQSLQTYLEAIGSGLLIDVINWSNREEEGEIFRS